MGVNGHVGKAFVSGEIFGALLEKSCFVVLLTNYVLEMVSYPSKFDCFDAKFRNSPAEILEFQSSKTVFKFLLEVVFLFL
jgi:hypothetical protein